MFGVTIGDKHSRKDWGMVMTDRVISPPSAKTNTISIPVRDGSLDLSESLTGDIKFEDRNITMTFSITEPIQRWSALVSEIENYLHGKRLKVIFDDDLAFYYVGRVVVDEWSSKKTIGRLVIRCTAEPYKYDKNSSADPWEWDPFDFETGIINELYDLRVSGEREVIVYGRRKKTYPIITANADMEVELMGQKLEIERDVPLRAYEYLLDEGENVLIFRGNGKVTIEYRGGSL